MYLWVLSTLVVAAPPAYSVTIDGANIGVSKMIPKVGDRVIWRVPVVNDSSERFEGDVEMTMRIAAGGERLGDAERVSKEIDPAPAAGDGELGGSEDFVFQWTPGENGYYRAVFEIAESDCRAVREIAVTQRDVYFVWFGAPKEFKWCNVPTTVKGEGEEWWLRRGAIPAHWKGGVCYREWSVERFVESWGADDWIAIDEVGGPGKVTDKFIEAWRRLKERKPEQWIAVWYMGAHDYWRDVRDLVDLFLPEIYLNYRGNHLGQFDSYLRVARRARVMDQVIPALGINQIKNDRGIVTNSPTKADVLRQFRYLKRTAPELRGIGFFTSYSAAPGVAEYADELCEKYFVGPVITIENIADPILISGDAADDVRRVTVNARNVGNMDASDVTIEWRYGWPERGAELTTETVVDWPVGEGRSFTIDLPRRRGWRPIEFRITNGDNYTVLDGNARDYVVFTDEDLAGAPCVVVPEGEDGAAGVLFVAVGDGGPRAVIELEPGGERDTLDAPCAVLPARPGKDERIAAFRAESKADGARMLMVTDGEPAGSGPRYSFEDAMLTVEADEYTVQLNCENDELTNLRPADCEGNLLRGPWTLSAEGHSGFGEARIEELPGCVVATVPYESDSAFGESQYVFFDYAPVIRIARSWSPKGEVALKRAADRCNVFQSGGTFALQPGVGGPIRRGRLHDSSKYRDLLFGYLGGHPRPENSDRAGWIDFSYGDEGPDGGFGVAIEYRWEDSDTKSYDVTRLYDASDWIEVLYVWGKTTVFNRPQTSCVYLVPHGSMDFTDSAVMPPAKALWDRLHERQLRLTGEL